MNLLRSIVREQGGWWEAKLLDLNIVADGDSEAAMLRELEYTLAAEYHLALKQGQTPFKSLLTGCPRETSQAWEDDGKKLRTLNLPKQVSVALAYLFERPNVTAFNLVESSGAKAA